MGAARLLFLAKHAARDAASARSLRRAGALLACACALAGALALGCAGCLLFAWIGRPPAGSVLYSELPGSSCPPALSEGASAMAIVAKGGSLRSATLVEAFRASCRMEGGRPVALLTLAGGASPIARSPLFQGWVAAQLPGELSSSAASWAWKPASQSSGWVRPSLEALGLAEPSAASRALGSSISNPPSGLGCAWAVLWRGAAGAAFALAFALSCGLLLILGLAAGSMAWEALLGSVEPAKAWLTRSDPASLSQAEAREIASSAKAAPKSPRGGRL